MENDKYYTPDLTDLRMGYELEKNYALGIITITDTQAGTSKEIDLSEAD